MRKRKTSTKRRFLDKRGLKKVPKGKEIDWKNVTQVWSGSTPTYSR